MAFCMAMFDVCHVVENLGSWWDYTGLMENEDLIVKAEEDMISNFDEIHTYMLKRHCKGDAVKMYYQLIEMAVETLKVPDTPSTAKPPGPKTRHTGGQSFPNLTSPIKSWNEPGQEEREAKKLHIALKVGANPTIKEQADAWLTVYNTVTLPGCNSAGYFAIRKIDGYLLPRQVTAPKQRQRVTARGSGTSPGKSRTPQKTGASQTPKGTPKKIVTFDPPSPSSSPLGKRGRTQVAQSPGKMELQSDVKVPPPFDIHCHLSLLLCSGPPASTGRSQFEDHRAAAGAARRQRKDPVYGGRQGETPEDGDIFVNENR